jgi:TP901 family phage tail tape measure protein
VPAEPIVLAVEAKDQATAIFAKIDGVLKGLGATFKSTASDAEGASEKAASGWSKMTPAVMGVGIAGAAVAAGVLLIGQHAFEAASQYQDAVATMAAQGEISIASATKVGNAFLDSAGKTVFSAQEQLAAIGPLSGQIEQITGHALNASDATTIMAGAMNLAEGASMDLGAATKDVTNVLQVYHQPLSQVSKDTDILFEASRITGQSVDAITTSVDRLAGRLGPLAPSLQDTATLMSDLSVHGLQGRLAMSAATTSLNTLTSGSKAANAEISALGLKVYNANGSFVGMGSVIDQLSPKLANMTLQQRLAAEKALFGASAGKELDAVLLAGSSAFNKLEGTITTHNAAQTAAEKQATTYKEQQKLLNSTMSDMWVMLGQNLVPVVQQFMSAIIPVITQIAQWINGHKQLTTTILIVTGVAGALIAVAATLALVIGLIASPVTLVILGFALLAAGAIYLYGHWKGFHDLVNWTWQNILKPVGEWIGKEAPVFWDALTRGIKTAGDQMSGFGNTMHIIWDDIKPIFDAIGKAMGGVGGFIQSVGNALGSHGNNIKGYATGGVVTSPTLALIGEEGPEAIVPLGSSYGSMAGLGGGGGGIVYIDLRGTSVVSDRDIDALLDKIGSRLVTQVLPNMGVNIRR